MTEARLIVVLVLAVSLLAGGAWSGYYFTAQHYQTVIDKDKLAQDTALQLAQKNVIDAQTARDKAIAQEEKDHAQLVSLDAANRTVVADSMHNLAAAVRARALSCAVATPAGGLGTAPSAGGSGAVQQSGAELDAAVNEFQAASDNLVGACQHDAREVTGILSVAPKP